MSFSGSPTRRPLSALLGALAGPCGFGMLERVGQALAKPVIIYCISTGLRSSRGISTGLRSSRGISTGLRSSRGISTGLWSSRLAEGIRIETNLWLPSKRFVRFHATLMKAVSTSTAERPHSAVVFKDTMKWVSVMHRRMDNDLCRVAKKLGIDKNTLQRWGQDKMSPPEHKKLTLQIRNRIKSFNDYLKSTGQPPLLNQAGAPPVVHAAGAARGPAGGSAGDTAPAEPHSGVLEKALITLLYARVAELEKNNEQLELANAEWLLITNDLLSINNGWLAVASRESTSSK